MVKIISDYYLEFIVWLKPAGCNLKEISGKKDLYFLI